MNNLRGGKLRAYRPANISEGERPALHVRVAAFRRLVPIQGIYPGKGHRKTTAIKMVFNCLFLPALTVKRANLVLVNECGAEHLI